MGSGVLAGYTFCVFANALCVFQSVCIYYVAIGAVQGSMQQLEHFTGTSTRPIRSCMEPDLRNGDMVSLDRFCNTPTPAHSPRLRSCGDCYCAARTREGIDVHVHECGNR